MPTSASSNTLVDRVSLRNLIDSSRRLDELGIARVIANVAEIVHKQQKGGQPLGTITPDAILVLANGDAALELGAAQAAYTAPEKLRGEGGDRRSDVFALGAVLWEALAHEQLFQGDIDGEIKAAVLEGDYRSAAETNANVPAELDAICKKALSRTPADRFPSCKVMAAELATVLDDAGYPEDNTAIAEYLRSQYVTPAPKPARVPSSRDTPLPGTPIVDLVTAPPTQTLQGVAPRKELEAAIELVKKREEQEAPRAKSPSAQPVGSATIMGTSPLAAEAPRAKSPSSQPVGSLPAWATGRPGSPSTSPDPSSTLPDVPTLLNTPPVETPAPKSEPAPKSFSKTAILGSLSGVDLPPVEEPAPEPEPATPVGRITQPLGSPAQSSASLADRLAAINQGSAPSPGGVLMLGLPAVPPGADPSSFKTPLPGSITTAETVATPALAGYAAAEQQAAAALAAVTQAPTLVPQAPILPATKTPPASEALQMPAAATGTAVSPADATRDSSPALAAAAGPHPASVVALPRARSKSEGGVVRDPLAGWGWGTGPHEVVGHDDDDFYETQKSTKKRLVYAIGGAAAAVLLIVVSAYAFGGDKKAKKADVDVAAKQAEPAVDWSQPTDPPPVAPPPQPDPNAGSAVVDPNAGSAVDPNAGSAVTDPNAGSAALAATPAPGSAAPPVEPPKVEAPAPPIAKVEPPKPEPPKPEPPKVEPKPEPPKVVAKVEPKPEPPKVVAKPEPPKVVAKVEPKKVEPKPKAVAKPKKLEPPKPVAKTDPRNASASWDPLKPAAKPVEAKKPPAPVDPYANDTPVKKPAVDANAAYKAGIQQFARGDSSGALTTFKSSLASNPDFAPTWRGIGMVYEKLGKKSQAKTAFRRYLQLSPTAGDAGSIRERMERL